GQRALRLRGALQPPAHTGAVRVPRSAGRAARPPGLSGARAAGLSRRAPRLGGAQAAGVRPPSAAALQSGRAAALPGTFLSPEPAPGAALRRLVGRRPAAAALPQPRGGAAPAGRLVSAPGGDRLRCPAGGLPPGDGLAPACRAPAAAAPHAQPLGQLQQPRQHYAESRADPLSVAPHRLCAGPRAVPLTRVPSWPGVLSADGRSAAGLAAAPARAARAGGPDAALAGRWRVMIGVGAAECAGRPFLASGGITSFGARSRRARLAPAARWPCAGHCQPSDRYRSALAPTAGWKRSRSDPTGP